MDASARFSYSLGDALNKVVRVMYEVRPGQAVTGVDVQVDVVGLPAVAPDLGVDLDVGATQPGHT